MSSEVFNSFKYNLSIQNVNWISNNFRCILVSNYTFNNNHNYLSDVQSYEISGDNYTPGGALLSNKTIENDILNNRVIFKADTIQWSNVRVNARGAIIYYNSGNVENSTLVCYIDFGSNKISNNTNFKIEFSQIEGIFELK